MKNFIITMIALLGATSVYASKKTWKCSTYTMGVQISHEYQGTESAENLAMKGANGGLCIYNAKTGVCPEFRGVKARADMSYVQTDLGKTEITQIEESLANPSGINGTLDYSVESDSEVYVSFNGIPAASNLWTARSKKSFGVKRLFKISEKEALYFDLDCSI